MKHLFLALHALFGLEYAQNTLLALLRSQGDLSSLYEAVLAVPGLPATLNALNGVTILVSRRLVALPSRELGLDKDLQRRSLRLV